MSSFLQTERWEAFQRALGRTTTRIDGQLAVHHTTPVGRYWYVPRPPTFDPAPFVDHARTDHAIFIRVDPETELSTTNSQLPIRPTAATQPQDSLILSLAPSADELLASFHEKTRYNIRVAQRHRVVVEESTDPDHRALTAFLQFTRRTADRQAFRYHPDSYYRTMLKALNEPNTKGISASVLVAHKDNGPAAAMIVLWTPETAYYLHGASWYERRQFMAPHLLQWTAIQRAKERGCTAYDFWGIAPRVVSSEVAPLRSSSYEGQASSKAYQFDSNHSWAGVTRFKLGFGGEVVHYPDSFDLVLNPAAYTIYTIGRRLRRQLPI